MNGESRDTKQVDTSLAQLNNSIAQLGLFDDVPDDREARESLSSQARLVNSAKCEMVNSEKKEMVMTRQMEASLDDSKCRRGIVDDDDLTKTSPLTRRRRRLKENHIHIKPSWPLNPIPLTFDLCSPYAHKPNQSIPPNFDLSSRRIATRQALDNEFTRVYEELGILQAHQDGATVKPYADAPDQLGLHEAELGRFRSKRNRWSIVKYYRESNFMRKTSADSAPRIRLSDEKSEKKPFLKELSGFRVRQLYEIKLGVARLSETKRLNANRGCEVSDIKLQ
ncbi:hypothetical protein CEK25_008953 [Fusarium fujikuroi]|nr:hypothetical protein CEK25_008953 [Fusarium fujikuroi]